MDNNPECKQHPKRKVELICLEKQCSFRFRLQCTKCINSNQCKRHSWKMLEEFIEEIFEVCETEQIRRENSIKYVDQGPKHREQISAIVNTMSEHLDRLKLKLVTSVEEHGHSILSQYTQHKPETEGRFIRVKKVVNNFRKSQNRDLQVLNNILVSLNEHIDCDQDGVLTLNQQKEQPKQKATNEMHDSEQAVIKDLKMHTQRILENIHKAIHSQNPEKQAAEVDQLKEQLEDLNLQIMKIPVLKQRIQDQALKIEAKEKKIKRYQEQLNGNNGQNHPDTIEKKNRQLSDKLMSDKLRISSRIQKLLEVRQVITKKAKDHLQKCKRETRKALILKSTEDAYSMDVGEKPCEQGDLINFSMKAVCDQLNHLGYNDGESQHNSFISVSILYKKPSSQGVQAAEIFNMFFGARPKNQSKGSIFKFG